MSVSQECEAALYVLRMRSRAVRAKNETFRCVMSVFAFVCFCVGPHVGMNYSGRKFR